MKLRIIKRKYSPNIIEILDETKEKETWIPFLIPVRLPKRIGDADAEMMFKKLTEPQP